MNHLTAPCQYLTPAEYGSAFERPDGMRIGLQDLSAPAWYATTVDGWVARCCIALAFVAWWALS